MPRTIPSPAAARAAAPFDLVNRRVTIRYPGSAVAEAETAPADGPCPQLHKARVHDVSQSGIALILEHPPTIGEPIYLQLTNRILDFTFDLSADVRHVSRRERGDWIVGLEFDEALSLAELAALL